MAARGRNFGRGGNGNASQPNRARKPGAYQPTLVLHQLTLQGDRTMPAYVYVLRSTVTGQHFIGSTSNLQDRISHYNRTSGRTYRPGGPWECVYVEVCDKLEDARKRERHLRSLDGVDEKIKILYTTAERTRQ
ncbi:MAG: hypothetical protein DYG96_14910 [Chlorobi bacterium CHB2]|nr:hypothetical protein [Chlorobi bacterium CHB2]